MHDVDLAAGEDGVGQVIAIVDLAAIDEHHHVPSQCALIVEHVAAQPWVLGEHGVEHGADRGAFDRRRLALHVPLEVRRERDGRHAGNLHEVPRATLGT